MTLVLAHEERVIRSALRLPGGMNKRGKSGVSHTGSSGVTHTYGGGLTQTALGDVLQTASAITAGQSEERR